VCFIGTRDIVHSLILTAAFIIFATGLHHSKSVYAREGLKNGDLATRGAVVMSSN
jgi:hypothetical protein